MKCERPRQRLEQAGIDVVGVTDHGFVQSIYFFDPNGIRLELTTETLGEGEAEQYKATAHELLAAWNAEKQGRTKESARVS